MDIHKNAEFLLHTGLSLFIGRTHAEAEVPILWPPQEKNQFHWYICISIHCHEHDIVQKAVFKPHPRKRNAKWFPDEALQIAVKREATSKGEKERYTHLNAEFQRIARRDKKAFLSDQCKEIEENNRMGKTRDLSKKIRDTKGLFHAKTVSVKDRNGVELTEAEDIKKR